VPNAKGTTFDIAPTSWTSYGTLQLNTPVLYAATLSDYRFNMLGESRVVVDPYIDPLTATAVNRDEPILSYGGEVSVSADQIVVNSRIQNPFGAISLNAQQQLSLGADSELSVAAVDDTKIPFGRVQAEDLYWTYTAFGNAPLRFSNDPENGQIELAIEAVENLGNDTIVYGRVVASDGEPIVIRMEGDHDFGLDQRVRVRCEPENIHLFDSKTGKRI